MSMNAECVWPCEGESSSSLPSCAVCLDHLEEEVLCQPCRHAFCRVCIHHVTEGDRQHAYTWSKAVPCPVCRQSILWTERPNTPQPNLLWEMLSGLLPHRSIGDEVEKVPLSVPGRHINRYLPSWTVHALEYWHSRRESIALGTACVVLLAVSVLVAAQVSTGLPAELTTASPDNSSQQMTRVIVSSLADMLIELAPTFIAVLSIGAVVCIVFAG